METDTSKKEAKQPLRARTTALTFVLLIGVMSFFADFTYEGSRSIIGPYLAVLGASALVVGIVTGFGELLGYGLRLVSGRLSEQTGKYWPITIVGYIIQMASVPLLALAGNWPVAVLLYSIPLPALIAFSLVVELAAIPLFLVVRWQFRPLTTGV